MSKTKKKNLKIKNLNSSQALKCQRFIGISLGGGKSEKTAVTVLEYYLKPQKLVVKQVIAPMDDEHHPSPDAKLHESVQQFKGTIDLMAIDAPQTLPKCFTCKLVCPGFEKCKEEEIIWMWKHHKKKLEDNKNVKIFTPYTRRCIETYWSKELEGGWAIGDALGSNQAPLLARSRYLTRRWKTPLIEVVPRLSLLRWSQNLKILKSPLKNYRHAVNGRIAREYLLRQMAQNLGLFFYEQDQIFYAEHLWAFDSLWAALTAFWKFNKKCEPRPKNFPKAEGWIEVPFF